MKIGLFTMGGTIAMRQQAVGGAVPSDGAKDLMSQAGFPSDLTIEQHDLFCKPSASVNLKDVAALAEAIEAASARGLAGAVVTHGTDTLEETAFALQLLLLRDTPVVVTGAMRSADTIGADGPANLAAAIKVAADPEARGLGVLVLFGDEIHAAHLVRKVHSSRPHAFSSEPFGPVGFVAEGNVRLELRPLRRLPRLRVGETIPVVPILQAGLDLEPETIKSFDNPSVAALVIAGAGGGHVSSRAVSEIERLARKVPVVMTSRVSMGPTLQNSYAYAGGDIDLGRRGILSGGGLSPSQARIVLQLCLSSSTSLQGFFPRQAINSERAK